MKLRALLRHPRVRTVGSKALLVVPVFVLWLLFVVTGLRGVDYGFHWDEVQWHITPVRNAVASGIMLPRSYIYPTFTKWLVFAPSVVVALRTGFATGFDAVRMQTDMLAAIDAPAYLLSVRRIFIVVSSLGIVWMYGAGLAFRMRWWAALVAAAGLGLSWEYAYHARYVATDCVLTQFSALVVFMLALYFRTSRARWLYAAAVAAGLATGAKYTGVNVLLPVVLASVLTLPLRPARALFAQAGRASLVCGIAFVAYLVTTPGMILDPFAFLWDTRWIAQAYAGSLGGYTATSGWDHARIALEFLTVGYFSPYKALATLGFVSALVGAGFWLRSERRVTAVLLICPVVFLVLFCSKFRIVTVRNYLYLIPFISVFMARAFSEASLRLARPVFRVALSFALLAIAVPQGVWLVRAGESIRHVDPNAYVRDALAYVARHPDTSFRLSDRVRSIALAKHLTVPPNVTSAPHAEEVVFFATSEGPGPWGWRSNDPWQANAVFGPREVNFDWYTTWAGHDRVVVMTVEKARATNIPGVR